MSIFRTVGFPAYVAMIFLNAFVDLGHKIVIQNTLFKSYDGDTQIILTAVVNALILLPYVMLFTPSGYLADKYPKARVMRFSAWAALGITIAISVCYFMGWFWPAFAMTFLLALQSAIYSPAKYGYIKELLGKESLAAGNGVVQATTTTAILAGIFLFSVVFEGLLDGAAYDSPDQIMGHMLPVGFALVIFTLMELWLAYRLPETRGVDADMHFEHDRYVSGHYLRENLLEAWKRPVIRLSIIGLSVFWAIAQVMVAAFPAFAKETMDIQNTVLIQGVLASSGIGIIIGSVIASRVSRGHIETGLIPVGAVGIALGLFLLPGLDDPFLHALDFLFIGAMGGLFIVPLNALIQFHAGEHGLGRVLAASNFIQHVVMLFFLAVTAMSAVMDAGSVLIIASLGFVGLAGAGYTVIKLPQSLVRFVIARTFSLRYRMNVLGMRNMPSRGGVLMLGNHISWIDWAMVQMASPRPVRFVMERSIYERWYLKWFLDLFGVVPIASGRSKEAIATITERLNAGDVVCLFPEGAISRNGQLGEFKRGFERATEGAEGVILPFYLRGLWGSSFSRSSDKLKAEGSRQSSRDVIVAFGEPLPMDSDTARVKQAVTELSVDSWQEHVRSMPNVASAWLQQACKHRGEISLIDTMGIQLSKRRFLTATLLFSRRIQRLSADRNVGILLPASSAGAITNMAALLAGKAVVNLNYTASPTAVSGGLKNAEVNHVFSSRRFIKKLEKRGVDVAALLGDVQVHYLEDLKDGISKLESVLTLIEASILPASMLALLHAQKVDPEQTAAILFSSGSEGTPKGIELSHRNLMANARQVSDVLNTQADDTVVANLPLFHAFGLTVTTFMPLLEGVPMVCHADPTDALGTAKAIAKHKATVLCSTSTFLRLYNRNGKIHPLMLESLRIVVAGAERLNPDVREGFGLKFNKPIFEGYGATETTPVASVNVPDAIEPETWKVQTGQKPGTVGMPLPGTAFRIVDPTTMESLPAGEDGMILIGGVQVMKGYLKAPEKTAEVVVELDGKRWYMTGDKGHLDKDGFLSIVDRYSRFAKLGGEMVSLSQVESQARALVDDPDAELVAVNLPDDKKGERIVLLVAGEVDTDALRSKLLGAGLNPLTLPASIHAIDAVPKLGSGKTDFAASKALAAGVA